MKLSRNSKDKQKSSKKYVWKSSIPQKWLDIKGTSYFEHVNNSNHPYKTIQFLKETQKYIHYICTGDRQIKSQYKEIRPSTQRALTHSHSEVSPEIFVPPASTTENSKQFPRRSSKLSAPCTQRSSSLAGSLSRPSYISISRCPSQSIFPSDSRQELNSDSCPYSVHKFAIPNGVLAFPKLKSSASENNLYGNDLNEFFHRFDKRNVDFTPARITRGFTGYKLTNSIPMSRSHEIKQRSRNSIVN